MTRLSFILCAHTIRVKTVTWTHYTSTTCDLCNADDVLTCEGGDIPKLWFWTRSGGILSDKDRKRKDDTDWGTFVCV